MTARTLWTLTTAFLGVLACGTPAPAQYQLELNAQAHANQQFGWDRSYYYFFPNLWGDTSISINLTSPNHRFRFEQTPEQTTGGSSRMHSTQEVLDEVNGDWNLKINDGVNEYEYTVQMELVIPFAELPYFESTTLVDGQSVGLFEWNLIGGEGAYPHELASIHAALYTTNYLELLDEEYLPITATSWAPVADFTRGEGYFATLGTTYEAEEGTLRVVSITPLSSGAPEVDFTRTSIRYGAELRAQLTPIAVPEPPAAVLALLSLSGIAALRRWSMKSA